MDWSFDSDLAEQQSGGLHIRPIRRAYSRTWYHLFASCLAWQPYLPPLLLLYERKDQRIFVSTYRLRVHIRSKPCDVFQPLYHHLFVIADLLIR